MTLTIYIMLMIVTIKLKDVSTPYQGYQFHTVPAGTAGIYRTGQQSGTLDPPVSYRKKYRPYRPRTGHTGQFRAIPTGTEKSFFFFFF